VQLVAFKKHLKNYTGMTKLKMLLQSSKSSFSPVMQLASRAVLIYLDKILLEKKAGTIGSLDSIEGGGGVVGVVSSLLPKKEDESGQLITQLDKLIQVKSEPTFQTYQSFFHEAETFLSPLCTLKDFKAAILKMIPIYAYLDKTAEIPPPDEE
jgi:hypothetical protein